MVGQALEVKIEVKTNIVIGSGRQQNTFVDLVHGLQQVLKVYIFVRGCNKVLCAW